jgi:hypothetical protein
MTGPCAIARDEKQSPPRRLGRRSLAAGCASEQHGSAPFDQWGGWLTAAVTVMSAPDLKLPPGTFEARAAGPHTMSA